MMPRAWTPSEDAILRASIACGLDAPEAKKELDKWGYARSLEGVAAHLQQIRKQVRAESGPQDAELLKYSISRKWL